MRTFLESAQKLFVGAINGLVLGAKMRKGKFYWRRLVGRQVSACMDFELSRARSELHLNHPTGRFNRSILHHRHRSQPIFITQEIGF
jgi:hypothetical protein